MILKGSQRANGADLAIHLMNKFDNESVEIAEVYGAIAGDLYGAFSEFEAVAAGTKATDYLYSLSINPSAPLTRKQYHEAIQAIESRLGLTDQPRAVVFHVKDGREHCHVVWSRIDIARMRAIHMAHDHRKLMDLACELAQKYGLDLPPGLKAWKAKEKFEKEGLEPTLAEKAQEAKTGITPEQRRDEITACYEQSGSAEVFAQALEQKGYMLAKGDRRGYVIVDENGDVQSLTRYVKGHRAAAIKEKLAALPPESLPSVEQAKELIRQRAQAQKDVAREQQHRTDERAQAALRAEERKAALFQQQAARQLDVRKAEQELLTRQQGERLSLHAAQAAESKQFFFRIRSAVADLLGRTPGLRSVLAPIQKLTHLDPKERHRLESGALGRRHEREKRDMERRKRFLARIETRERASLEKALRREQRLKEAARLAAAHEQEEPRAADNKAKQDFFEAAKDQGLWKEREFKEGELSETFNAAAGFQRRWSKPDGGGDGHAPDSDPGTNGNGHDENAGPKHRRRRGRGYGHRRED